MAKHAVDAAIAALQSQIDDLQRAQRALLAVSETQHAFAEKPKRGRGKNKPKPGLPAQDAGI